MTLRHWRGKSARVAIIGRERGNMGLSTGMVNVSNERDGWAW